MPDGEFGTDDVLKWTKADDRRSRSERVRRVLKLLDLMPLPTTGFGLHDGETSPYLFNEIRLAYSHGLYLAVVLLSLAFIEKQIAAALYTIGDNEVTSLPLGSLIERAESKNIIDPTLRQGIDGLRRLRNAYAHFREPGHQEGVARRMRALDSNAETVLEADADSALKIAGKFLLHRGF